MFAHDRDINTEESAPVDGVVRHRRPAPNHEENKNNRNDTNPNRNQDLFEGRILPAINGILPLPIEGIDEREIYTRFTSSELASYMINLLKERIHTLRLIFTLFVIVFTNLTNMLILLPSKASFWETVLKQMIYLTPVIQFVWFVLLVLGKNNSKFYVTLKFSLLGLISLTSVVAYFWVMEDDIFQKCDSHIVFIICMANISATLLWCFFVLFSIGLIIVASIISLMFAFVLLPFLIVYLLGRLLFNTCRESVVQVYRIYSMNRMKSLYQIKSTKIKDTKQSSTSEENSCAIWFLEFKQDVDYVLNFDCKHTFHQSWVEQWLKMNKNSCPLCRTKIF